MLGSQIFAHAVLNWTSRYAETSAFSGRILAEAGVLALLLSRPILAEKPVIGTLLGVADLAGFFLLLSCRLRAAGLCLCCFGEGA